MSDNLIAKSNPMVDVKIEESGPDDWGWWECPNCGQMWEDPNKVERTCCGICDQIVKLSGMDKNGRREATADGFLPQ